MTSRILTALGVLALTASYAEARPKFSAQLTYGLSGSAEAEAGGVSGDADLESSIGAMGTVEWQLSRKSPFRLGLRVGYQTLTTDENNVEADYSALDGGIWARYIFVPGRFVVYGAGSLAYSALTADSDGPGDAEGNGINIMLGAGASFPVAKGMRLTGGLYFSRHQGELDVDNTTGTVDLVIQQVQLAVGVAF